MRTLRSVTPSSIGALGTSHRLGLSSRPPHRPLPRPQVDIVRPKRCTGHVNYRFHPHQLWTAGGALMVVNNLIHWNNPPRQTSYIARRHKLATCVVLAAYAYHFLIEEQR